MRQNNLVGAGPAVRGFPFRHFFCPILHIDEPGEIIKGHIVPESIKAINEPDRPKASNAWVPQRKDIDNFYGAVTEADFGAAIRDRGKSSIELWTDPKLNRQHKPRLELEGTVIPHYFTKTSSKISPEHTRGEFVGGDQMWNLVVKLPPSEMEKINDKTIQIVIDRDYHPMFIASLIKAAHLTLFQLMGYGHVFSPGGVHLASILRTFYLQNSQSGNVPESVVAAHFMPYTRMAAPMGSANSAFDGTISDARMFVCVGGSDRIFALAVIVKAHKDTFCVFVPNDDPESVGTYEGFINEPPKSIRARQVKFVSDSAQMPSHWQMDTTDFRAYFSQPKE